MAEYSIIKCKNNNGRVVMMCENIKRVYYRHKDLDNFRKFNKSCKDIDDLHVALKLFLNVINEAFRHRGGTDYMVISQSFVKDDPYTYFIAANAVSIRKD